MIFPNYVFSDMPSFIRPVRMTSRGCAKGQARLFPAPWLKDRADDYAGWGNVLFYRICADRLLGTLAIPRSIAIDSQGYWKQRIARMDGYHRRMRRDSS